MKHLTQAGENAARENFVWVGVVTSSRVPLGSRQACWGAAASRWRAKGEGTEAALCQELANLKKEIENLEAKIEDPERKAAERQRGGRLMADEKPPPLPMPRLISVAEEARLRAAGEWPPPDPAPPPPTAAERTAPGGERTRMPRHVLEANIAAFYKRLRAPQPWSLERTARKEAEAEKAKKDEDG